MCVRIVWENRTIINDRGKNEVTEEEIVAAVSHIKAGRAPGPDGIPPEAIKWLAEKRSREVAKMLNGLYQQGTFPTQWKRVRVLRRNNRHHWM